MRNSTKMTEGKGSLKGPTNLNKIMPGKAGAKMTKPHRIKSRAPKGGGR